MFTTNHLRRFFTTMTAVLFAATALAEPVNIQLVPVRNAGNASDSLNFTGQFGSVPYEFSIAAHEVTIGQYAAFLNAVAQTDTNGLYNAQMGTSPRVRGITRNGTSGAYTYTTTGPDGVSYGQSTANRPITFVSWLSAARFANWMSNGQPAGLQNSSTTENGAYDLTATPWGVPRNTVNPNTGAPPLFHIPTENEWYKAALYSPQLNEGAGGYYSYATQSFAVPGNQLNGGINQANVGLGGVYSLTQTTDPVNQNLLTDIGAFINSKSFYGTFDQTGNVQEWTETIASADHLKRIRGSSFDVSNMQDYQERFVGDSSGAWSARENLGFRLASPAVVPEPSTWVMGAVGVACAGWRAWRRKTAA